MNKFIKMISLAVIVVILGGLAIGAVAFAQGPTGDPGFGRFGNPDGPVSFGRFGAHGPLGNREEMKAAMAQALGMSVEELEAELASEKTVREIAEERGVSPEDLRAAIKKAAEEALDKAVQNGDLTQEEADRIKERMENGPRGKGAHGPLGNREEIKAVMAQALGMSVEELEAELEGGKTVREIADERGVSPEDLRAAMKKAAEEALEKAVQNGDLTEEEANRIKERLENGPHSNRPHGPLGNREAMKEKLAETLGMSVEELEAELESGKTIRDIAAERGLERPLRPQPGRSQI